MAAPLVLDSTEPEVMQAGLEWIGGRAVLNSANLEDGDAEGARLDRVLALAKEYGAAVVCLLIDEEGQARDLEWKMRVAHRLYRLAIDRYGLAPSDLIFDALTFPLSTGDDDLRKDGLATIEAIRRIKAELPGAYTTLGVSNVSFGLKPAARHVLNSMFLHECLDAGLDSAIVHAGRIIPLNRIEPHHRDVCLDLIYDRRGPAGLASGGRDDYDPLTELLAAFENVTATAAVKEDRSGWPVEQRLERRIIDGERDGLEADLDEALASTPALDIVNETLLAGMKVVGDLFASGEMQLPFVLQSAETMKTAVSYLEPHMERTDDTGGKGRIVLATVKGDVHDIGKNLVDIILTNNGYEVHNLGIKVSITEMIDKALEVDAHALGMSGLLVKSTLIMRDNLEELNTRGLERLPVLLGGAALTRTYVERDMRETYRGRVFYGKDAFEGLAVMDRLGELRRTGADDPDFGRRPGGRDLPRRARRDASGAAGDDRPERAPSVSIDNPVFEPPFVGSRVVKGIPVADIAEYVNETALFRNQWQFRPVNGEDDAAFKERIRPTMREQLASATAQGLLVPQVVYGYFPVNGKRGRPGGVGRPPPHRRALPLPVSPPAQRPIPVHRRLLPPRRRRRGGLRRLPHRDHGGRGVKGGSQDVRRQPLPGLPPAPRPRGGDGRGSGRILAPPHPHRVGFRRRGRPHPHRPVPPAIPRWPLLLGLPGLPRPRGQPHRGPTPRRRTHRHPGRRGNQLPIPTRANHLRPHLPPPPSQVLRRPLTCRTSGAVRGDPSSD